jgi:hypothetical protein
MHRWRLVLIQLVIVCGLLFAAGGAAADGSCGDGTCDPGEDCGNCGADCGCLGGQVCDGGSCRPDCDVNACEFWDAANQRCKSVCDEETEYCSHGYCASLCDPTKCEDKRVDLDGECVDRCPEQGKVCNGINNCQCPEGQVDWGGVCKPECLPVLCQYADEDGDCRNYCEDTNGVCSYDGPWPTTPSNCICNERCDRTDWEESGLCVDSCEPSGSECLQGADNEDGSEKWGCFCPAGTEMVNVDNEIHCEPLCSSALCEQRSRSSGECKDVCPPANLVCVYDPVLEAGFCECPEGTHEVSDGCLPDCDPDACEHDDGTGECPSYCGDGEVCDGMGTCLPDCDPDACEYADGTDECASYCVGGEVCDGMGGCDCPFGTHWDGSSCVPDCDPYNCQYDAGWGCASWCGGGQSCNGMGSCVCASGTHWNGSSCVSDCNPYNCEYDDGMGGCASSCPGGTTCNAGSCECPAGTYWNGMGCDPY